MTFRLLPPSAVCALGSALSLASLGCASSSSHGSSSDAGAACTRAGGLTTLDGSSTTECVGAAGVVTCMHAGYSETCFTDDLTTCPDADAFFEGGPYSCADQCAANEYAVSCGLRTVPPPSGCHQATADYGPSVTCCPCL